MESIASHIVNLNNLGLAHFLAGDYPKAIDSFGIACHAIDRFRFQASDDNCSDEGITAGPQQSKTDSFREDKVSSTMDQYIEQVLRKTTPSKNPEPSTPSVASSTSIHSLYNRGLVIWTDQNDHILTGGYIHRTSAVIFYNLALVYHNMGVRQGVSAALPQALRIYESALDCLRYVNCIVECHKVMMAILNNMGNIYAQYFQADQTNECFKKLRQALSIPNPSLAVDEDYMFFLLNALFQPKELCFAPAA